MARRGFFAAKGEFDALCHLQFTQTAATLEKLGKHTTSVGCLYIATADVDEAILEELVADTTSTSRRSLTDVRLYDVSGSTTYFAKTIAIYRCAVLLEVNSSAAPRKIFSTHEPRSNGAHSAAAGRVNEFQYV